MKIRFVAAVIAVALVVSACAVSGPEATAKKFIIELSAMHWDEAKKLSTEQGAQVLDMFKGLMSMMSEEQIKQSKKTVNASDITIVSSKTDGDSATVVYKIKGEDKENTLNMKKVDGQWKVDYSKNF